MREHPITAPEDWSLRTYTRTGGWHASCWALRGMSSTNDQGAEAVRTKPDFTMPLHGVQGNGETLASVPGTLYLEFQRQRYRSRERTRRLSNLNIEYVKFQKICVLPKDSSIETVLNYRQLNG